MLVERKVYFLERLHADETQSSQSFMNNEITAILNDDDLSRGETTPRSTKDLFECLSFWHYKASGLAWSESIATHNSVTEAA